MDIMIWLIILIICIVVEAATMGLTMVWFAGGSLVAAIAAALNAPLVVQIILFLIVSFLMVFFTRPIAVKYFNKKRVKTNVESMIGRQAIVISEIDNLQGIGQVTVGGQEWSARSEDDDVKIKVGAVVDIMAVSGVKLIVREEAQA
ncbi:MAG: NfeD family protein [Lachnospiraceae bacterium]|nr:NfeD family protein [Lachnospiraceae bacterium]